MNRTLLALAIAVAWLPNAAMAFGFGESDGLHGNFDTTVSYGASWRVQGRDATLIGAGNGGVGSLNGDDGNLNYNTGDITASLLKVTHELDLSVDRYGFFARGYYFHDFENASRTGPAPVVGGVTGTGYTFGDQAHDRIGTGYKMLDAYAKASFALGERKTQVRLGNQVLSWGESMYITNGINVINSADVSKLRTPGSELKEALLPSPMLWASQELSDTANIEAFAIAKFKKIELDPRGSFFSTNDFISDDGSVFYLRGPDQHFPARPGVTQSIPRGADREARNSGEFGVAMHVLAPELNNTEFGLYYLNYHQRAPIISTRRGGVNVAGVPVPINAPTNAPTTAAAQFFVEYPENIHLYGVSFNTAGPAGIAFAGEYSYRPNLPLQITGGELFLAAIGLQNSVTGNALAAATLPIGTEISGYRRVKAHQVQMSATKAFSNALGFDQVVLTSEIGFTHLQLPDGVYFGGYGETTPAGSFGAPATGAGQGFATPNSWGYQLAVSADYNNAIGAWRLSPRLAYSQAVRGVSPTWNQGVQSLTVGLTGTLGDQWRADIGYTAFIGGRVFNGTVNTNSSKDRDFVAASLSYAF